MAYNSTIITQKKNLACGHFDYNFSRNRCKQCATVEDFNTKMEKEVESEGFGDLIKDADALFSKWVRMSAADKNGIATCYTCGDQKRWQEQQCGHYISRSNLYLRWDLRNARVQCEICNCHKHGNMLAFGKRLELEFPNITEILYEESKLVYKPTREEVRQIISEFTDKIVGLKYVKNNVDL